MPSIPVDVTQECFVKYTFPEAVDFSSFDISKLQTSGLLRHRNDLIHQTNLETSEEEAKFIVLKGCNLTLE